MSACLPAACLSHLRSAGSAARTSNKNVRAVPLILFVYNKGSIGASLQISEHQQMQQKQQFADSIRDPGIFQNIFNADICDPSNSTNTSQVKYYNLKKCKLLFFYLWIFYFIVLLIFYRSWRIGGSKKFASLGGSNIAYGRCSKKKEATRLLLHLGFIIFMSSPEESKKSFHILHCLHLCIVVGAHCALV